MLRARLALTLLALAMTVSVMLEVGASEDPAHPTPWSGVGIERRNDGRAHNYYYRLPTRHVAGTSERVINLRVLGRGNGTVKATVQGAPADPSRTFVTCNLGVADASRMSETRASGVANAVAPYLQITVTAGIQEWSVMVEESTRRRPQHAPPHGTPSPSPSAAPSTGPVPPVPGGGTAAPWPASGLSEAIPEGYRPVYYWRDFPGGTATVDMSITTPFSATCTIEVMDPHGTAESPFAMWTVSHTGLGADGHPATQRWTDTHAIPAGRYLLRLTRESASRQSSYTLNIH